jgi:hypothetical protein
MRGGGGGVGVLFYVLLFNEASLSDDPKITSPLCEIKILVMFSSIAVLRR